jgi:hypothetical protein
MKQKLCQKQVWDRWEHHQCKKTAKFSVTFEPDKSLDVPTETIYLCGLHARFYKQHPDLIKKIETL